MCVARHARHVFVGAFVGAVRNVAAHTRPGRSSAGVATAYLAGPNGVRPAAAAAAHRRVTSAEGGRFEDASAAAASAPEAHATCPARMFHTAANRRMVARCLPSRGSAARCLATRDISAAAARPSALGFDHADAGPGVVRVVSVPGFEPVTSARAHAAARVAAWRKRREARAYERHFRTARGPGHAPSAAKRVARANETSADAKSPESNAAIPEEIHSRVGARAGPPW